LSKFANIKHVEKTRHYEHETLYWTKAASILGKPQKKMLDSEVPIPRESARTDLITLLTDNLNAFCIPNDDKELIFDGWVQLCKKYSPVFLEKSPHHLYQWSALELMVEAIECNKSVDYFFIGLVRNPMDVLYSAFKRWKTIPEVLQFEWLVSYQNLRKLCNILPEQQLVIRYEDMVSSLDCLRPAFDFCEVSVEEQGESFFHDKSIHKWKDDKLFGFQLDRVVQEFAKTYGYADEDLVNRNNVIWPAYRSATRARHKLLNKSKQALKRMVPEPRSEDLGKRQRM
jgi:hypothetical protein